MEARLEEERASLQRQREAVEEEALELAEAKERRSGLLGRIEKDGRQARRLRRRAAELEARIAELEAAAAAAAAAAPPSSSGPSTSQPFPTAPPEPDFGPCGPGGCVYPNEP